MKKIGRIAELLLVLCLMAGTALAEQTAVIDAGNSTKLHLRAQASASAESLGLFFTGTTVNCLSQTNGWIKVQVGADFGYMDSRYLRMNGEYVASKQPQGWIVAKNGANMRSGPSTAYEQLKTLRYGEIVTILGETDEHWYYVNAGGWLGYVSTKLVSLENPNIAESYLVIDAGNSTKVHLRQDARQSSDSLGLYFTGTAAELMHQRGEWTYVKIGEDQGYIMTKFLRSGKEASRIVPRQPQGYVKAKNGANLRSGPNTDYRHMRTLAYGESMTIMGETVDHWYYVNTAGQTGYVSAKLISMNPVQPQKPIVPQRPKATQMPSAVLPQNLPQQWLFSSGAGAWGTFLYLNQDGSFTGRYDDSDGRDHYESDFSGRFTNVRQVDALTYTMTLDQLTVQGNIGSSYWADEMHNIITAPTGLQAGETFTLHLPGTQTTNWTQEKREWLINDTGVLQDFYLYGHMSESGFVSGEW